MIGLSTALILFPKARKEEWMLVVLGSILLDIERPLSILLRDSSLGWLELTEGTHSIIGALALSFFAASCFIHMNLDFTQRFRLVLLGCATHLIMDMTMWPWAEYGVKLLYPLRLPISFNLIWGDSVIYPLIGMIALLFAFSSWYFRRR
jgi:hypothetical protein